jgi:hypothetical protein
MRLCHGKSMQAYLSAEKLLKELGPEIQWIVGE